MSENKKLVPKRRFKEFQNTDAWEQRELGEVVEFFSGLTYSPSNVVMENGTLVLRSSNVKNGEIVKNDNVFVDDEAVNSENVKAGDIVVVVRNGSRNLIGKHAQVKENMDKTVIGAFMTGVRAEQPSFINALLDTKRFEFEIAQNLGATINQITTGAFKKMKFMFPENDEKHKIGEFFNTLDQTIAFQQRKLEKMKSMKSAYLSEMFPAEGERKPKRRFPGFTDDWEQCEFSSLAIVRRGLTYKPTDVQDDGVRVLRSSNINENVFELKNDDVFVKQESANIDGVVNGDILITSANGSSRLVGKHALVEGIKEKTVHGGFMLVARAKRPHFTNALMSTTWYNKFIDIFVSGGNGAIGNLRKSDLESQNVLIPSGEEQERIGKFFSNLNNTIAFQQQKLEKLQNIKKAYLNEMFI